MNEKFHKVTDKIITLGNMGAEISKDFCEKKKMHYNVWVSKVKQIQTHRNLDL